MKSNPNDNLPTLEHLQKVRQMLERGRVKPPPPEALKAMVEQMTPAQRRDLLELPPSSKTNEETYVLIFSQGRLEYDSQTHPAKVRELLNVLDSFPDAIPSSKPDSKPPQK